MDPTELAHQNFHPSKDIFLAEITAITRSVTDTSGTFVPHGWKEKEAYTEARGFRDKFAGRVGSVTTNPAFSPKGDAFSVGDLVYIRHRSWTRVSGVNDTTYEIIGLAGANSDGYGEICTEFAVRCENGVLITRYLRVRGTVSDTPCAGLGGGGMGGPPLGEGGPPPRPGPGPAPAPGPTPECPPGSTYGWTAAEGWRCYSAHDCPPGTYWGWSVSYGGFTCIPLYSVDSGNAHHGSSGWRVGLVGMPMGGGRAMGGSYVLDDAPPVGTTTQVYSWDSSGNPVAKTLPSSLGTVRPGAISAHTHNYAPGAAKLVFMSTDSGTYNLTGLSMSQIDGQEVTLRNDASLGTITIKIADANSSAANRFHNGSSIADITLGPQGTARFIYSTDNSLWWYMG